MATVHDRTGELRCTSSSVPLVKLDPWAPFNRSPMRTRSCGLRGRLSPTGSHPLAVSNTSPCQPVRLRASISITAQVRSLSLFSGITVIWESVCRTLPRRHELCHLLQTWTDAQSIEVRIALGVSCMKGRLGNFHKLLGNVWQNSLSRAQRTSPNRNRCKHSFESHFRTDSSPRHSFWTTVIPQMPASTKTAWIRSKRPVDPRIICPFRMQSPATLHGPVCSAAEASRRALSPAPRPVPSPSFSIPTESMLRPRKSVSECNTRLFKHVNRRISLTFVSRKLA